MSWLVQWPAFTAGIAVLLVPGVLAALILRLRGFLVIAVAAPLSVAAIGAASVLNMVVPFRWGTVAWVVSVVALLVACAIVSFVRRRWGGTPGSPAGESAVPHTPWLPLVSVAIAAAVLVPRLVFAFDQPENISQTFDNIYHLNAVRYVLDAATIAPTRQIIPGFYPSLWHAVTATVASLSGASIPVAVNVVSIILGGLVWPLSCVWLVWQIAGSSPAAVAVAGPLSAGFAAFPLLMLDFGVLYPNVLSIALLPAALAALVAVCGLGTGERPDIFVRWALLLAAVAVVTLAHPSTLMAFFAIGFWPAVWAGVRWFSRARSRGLRTRTVVMASIGWAVGLTVAALLLRYAKPTAAQAFWRATMSPLEAVAQVTFNGPVGRPWQPAVSVLVLIGVVAILGWQRHRIWLVLGWLTIGFIYVVCASFPDSSFRYNLTGTWYSDLNRIAALLPVAAIPLASVGFAVVIHWLTAWFVRRRSDSSRWRAESLAVAAGVAIVLAFTQWGPSLQVATASARGAYAIGESSPLLSLDERSLIDRLPGQVPAEDVIVGSPWTGTSLTYALADRRSLYSHIYQEPDQDMETIAFGLNRADVDPDVCSALERADARWVLDFGRQEVHGSFHPFPGLTDLASSDVVELVDSEGTDARLYRIVACA